MSKKRRELELQKQKQKRRNTIIISTVVCLCVTAAAGFIIWAQPTPISTSFNDNGDLIFSAEEITSKLSYIDYGDSQNLLAWRNEEGEVRTAFNTCEECYASGNATYTRQNEILICRNCQNSVPITTLGESIWGSCQPVSIPADYRADTVSQVVIPAEVLEFSDQMFAAWDEGNYEIRLSEYGASDDIENDGEGDIEDDVEGANFES